MQDSPLAILLYIATTMLISRLMIYLVYCYEFRDFNFTNFITKFNVFDANWYIRYIDGITDNIKLISTGPINGDGQAWWAFFPFFPTLIASIWSLIGKCLNVYCVGMFVNTVLFCTSEFFAYKYILLTRKNEYIAYLYITFMSLGLYTFYFFALYSEALFLFLLVFCFYFLEKEEYIKMGLAGALMSATRNYGVMFVFVILIKMLQRYIKIANLTNNGNVVLAFANFTKECILNSRLVLGTMLIPLGLFTYMSFLSYCTGDGFAFVHVQRAWARNAKGIIVNIFDGVARNFPPTFRSVAVVIILCVMIYFLFTEKRIEEFALPFIILILSGSTSLSSIPRYMVGSFTFVLGFCDIYAKMNKVAKIMLGILIVAFELILIKNWFAHNSLLI